MEGDTVCQSKVSLKLDVQCHMTGPCEQAAIKVRVCNMMPTAQLPKEYGLAASDSIFTSDALDLTHFIHRLELNRDWCHGMTSKASLGGRTLRELHDF